MYNLTRALEAWRGVVGPKHVLTDPTTLSAAGTATFATANRVPAIVRPGSREEVRACVRVANEHLTPIYPVSTGKNWGYGSRVPPADGCVLMELHRLNRIVDCDERLAYVTVEPGVTFRQLHAFLLARKSNLMLSVTGSTPDSSPVGNALERGAGSGPYADRAAHICGLEVVLPTGDVVHTGFGRFEGAKTAKLHRWGVGPYLDGLFAQSNLGIVTEMTMWLAPRPDYFQSCYCGIDDEARLREFIDALQALMLKGTFRSGLTVRNDFNVLVRMQQYPWEALGGARPMPPELLERMRKGFWHDAWWNSLWIGWAELHHASKEHGLAERKVIEEALKDQVDRLAFVDEEGVAFSRWEADGDREMAARYFGRDDGADVGVPGDENIRSAYWRKKTPVPEDMDPDRDRCGVMFCVPALPFEGRHVRAALEIIEDTLAKHGFEPILIIGCVSERVVYLNVDITYDREVEGEDERALGCHDALLGRLIRAGYVPYRLGIESVKLLPESDDDTGKLLDALKKSLDPNNILAPGRYGLAAEGRSRKETHARERGDLGVVHVSPGGGRSVWFNGGLVTFYALGEDTGGAFTLFEEAIAPQDKALPHLHHEEDQAFYVLEGEYEFVCDGRAFAAKAGSFVYVPRGTVHSYENVGTEAGRILILSAPAGGTERLFFELGEPAMEGSPPPPPAPLDLAAFRATVQRYGSDIDLFALLQQVNAAHQRKQDATE